MRTSVKLWGGALLLVLVGVAVASCSPDPSDPDVQSDSSQVYSKAKVPTDTNVYVITGVVDSGVESLTRQTSPGQGSTTGYRGYVSGSYFGPTEAGKGYVRVRVTSVDRANDSTKIGDVSILKVTDTKATALLPGDLVTFKCRRQYEAIAAIQNNQRLDVLADGTWELDYCRMYTPTAHLTPQ